MNGRYEEAVQTNMYENIIARKFLNKNGDELSISVTQVGQVPESRCIHADFEIDEIQEFEMICPENLIRVSYPEEVNQRDNCYYINYMSSMIIFSPNLINYNFEMKYWATGFERISANKIYTILDNSGKVVQTLEELTDAIQFIKNASERIENLDVMITTIETEEENLTSQIETIEQDTVTATQVNKILNTTKNQAVQTNKDLIENNNLATNIIDTIKEKTDIGNNLVNTLSSKITDSINASNTLTNDTSLANSSIKNLQELIPKGQDLVKDIKNPDYFYKSIPSENFTKNNDTGMYEYNMSHNLNTDKYDISLWDTDGNQIVNLGEKIDNNTYKIVNDEKIDIIAVCGNKGSWNGTT